MINPLIGVLLGSTALLVAGNAVAADRWVSPSGTATSGCTKEVPCGTVRAASDAAATGEFINIQGSVPLSAFTTTKDGVKYRCVDGTGAYKRWSCKIQPKNGTADDSTLWTNTGQNVEIIGIEADLRTPDGRNSARVGIYSSPIGKGPVTYRETHVHHGYQRGCSGGGAGLLSDAYNTADAVVNFDSNYVHNIGSEHCNQVHGIYMSTNGYVRNNVANDNGGWGIQSWHDAKENDVDNNTACGNKSGNISVGAGDYYHPAKPWTGTMRNNIVCNAPYGINVYGSIASSQPFQNNLASNNGINWNLGSQTCTGCLTGSVKFVDAAAGNYHLQEGSPGIDQGIALASVKTDMDGVARPQDSGHDIGAYEYKSGGNPNPPEPPPNTSVTCSFSTAPVNVPLDGSVVPAGPLAVACQ